MNHKKLLSLVVVLAFFPLMTVIAMTQFRGTMFEDLVGGISALMVYALMLVGSLLRVAITLLGVFAIYKVLWERVNARRAVGGEL